MSKKKWRKLQKTLSTNSCKTTKMETRSARAAKKQEAKKKKLKKLENWKFQDLGSFLIPKDDDTVSIQTETDVDVDEASSTVFAAKENDNCDLITRANETELNSSFVRSTSAPVSPKPTNVRENYRNRRESASATATKDCISSDNKTDTQQVATTDIDLFFDCIAATVKKFRPYNQLIAKTTVFSLISQIEMFEMYGTTQFLPSANVPYPLPNNTLAFAPIPSLFSQSASASAPFPQSAHAPVPFPQSAHTPVPPASEIQPPQSSTH